MHHRLLLVLPTHGSQLLDVPKPQASEVADRK